MTPFLSQPHRYRRLPLFLLLCGALLVSACGGGGGSDDPREIPEPPPVMAQSMSGTITSGAEPFLTAPVVKGAVGLSRRTDGNRETGAYSVTLQQLEGPYMVENEGGEDSPLVNVMHAVSTRGGNVNVTPLTSLVSVYAIRQVPDVFFDLLPNQNGSDLSVVTEASIARGEMRARSLLADWGIEVPAGITSLTYDAFEARSGDAMYGLLMQFRQEMIDRGTNLDELVEEIGIQQALCRVESVTYTSGTREDDFCPSARSTSRVDGVDVYSFTAPGNDVLTVRAAADGSVASAELTDNGVLAFSCSGAACSGVSIGAPNAEGRRSIEFDGAMLARAGGGSATFEGSLLADALGMPSPQTLSCELAGGSYHALLSASNTFPGTCVDPGQFLFSGPQERGTFFLTGFGIEDEIVVDGKTLFLRVHADGAQPVSAILFSSGGAFGNTRFAEFKCGGVGFPACNGVAVDLSQNGLDDGSITLDDTVLYRVDAGGQPVMGDTATVRADALVTSPVVDSFARADCEFFPEIVNLTASDDPVVYPYCPDEADGETNAGPFGDEVRYLASNGLAGGSGRIAVYTQPGSLEPVRVEADRQGNGVELFVCDEPACLAGVTLTRNAEGRTTVTFDNVALEERDLINTAGDRAAVLTDGAISFPAFE